MKLKSYLSALLLLAMLAALTGCANQTRDTSSADKVPESASANQPTAETPQKIERQVDAPIELTLWYAGGKTAVNVLAEIVADFNASQDAYRVTTVTQADYSETYQKVQAGIAGGSAPDIALLDVSDATSLAKKDLLENLSPLMDADTGFDRSDYIESFFSSGVLPDGSVFALPAYGTTQVLYYNIAAFESAGIDPALIKTWQDLERAATEMTVKENGETVFYGWEPMYGVSNMIDAVLSNGGKVFSEDGRTAFINTPEWVEVWEAFRRWIHDDKIMTIHYGGQGWEYWYKTIDDVLQNKAGGYTGSSGDQADLDFSIVGALEQPGWNSNPSAPSASALQFVAPKNDNAAAAAGAYEFMKFYTSPENQAKWSMATGYIPVRKSTVDVPEYKAYTDANPHALVPMSQALHSRVLPVDPTGNLVYYALTIAADKVEIENFSAQEALDEAQEAAQAALDEYYGG
ncbi:MAG: ABC transporter substrate-binding protein [Oscillospiraceae bacterium]|jgi:multiple sugar transport system substrate-binding protein|nr:ABC transporter substrate-binding protein [Oscillospiraceae bacterium]